LQLLTTEGGRSSFSSIGTSPVLGQSLLSTNSKLKYNKKKVEKEFQSGWLKKSINQIIDSIEHVLCD
jgi:hypothetical protein